MQKMMMISDVVWFGVSERVNYVGVLWHQNYFRWRLISFQIDVLIWVGLGEFFLYFRTPIRKPQKFAFSTGFDDAWRHQFRVMQL